MKKVWMILLIVWIVLAPQVVRSEEGNRLVNHHCGVGYCKNDFDEELIMTPCGCVFKVLEIQRSSFTGTEEVSCSFNEETQQLFLFKKVKPYKFLDIECDTEMTPSTAFKVRRIKKCE